VATATASLRRRLPTELGSSSRALNRDSPEPRYAANAKKLMRRTRAAILNSSEKTTNEHAGDHQGADKVEIVPSTSDLFRRGADFFSARPDNEWSLTDCISFVVMNEPAINDALTKDHHFEQAGFRILLKD
jgi:predicted nucleic acid-binding protein